MLVVDVEKWRILDARHEKLAYGPESGRRIGNKVKIVLNELYGLRLTRIAEYGEKDFGPNSRPQFCFSPAIT